jgi:RecA-family ATPase
MDRASGSGVFARDADALLDMIELRIPTESAEMIRNVYGEKVTAWRMDATLREFQRIEPVNLFFSYPLHELDTGDILKDANLEENERSMENGREMGNIAKKVKKAANKADLAEAMARDEEFSGKRKTQKEYADEFGVTDRTIRGWMRELEEDI